MVFRVWLWSLQICCTELWTTFIVHHDGLASLQTNTKDLKNSLCCVFHSYLRRGNHTGSRMYVIALPRKPKTITACRRLKSLVRTIIKPPCWTVTLAQIPHVANSVHLQSFCVEVKVIGNSLILSLECMMCRRDNVRGYSWRCYVPLIVNWMI